MAKNAQTSAPISPDFEEGSQLVFIIGAFRGGTTLLRKMLDSHPCLYSPAETWFLLPLLNLWDGKGQAPTYAPSQAAAAIQSHLNAPQFLECCRAFAAKFYAANLPTTAKYFIDKTPPYLHIAPALPVMFPRARFLVLSREPRGLCWSRHTWKHMNSASPETQFPGVVNDLKLLAAFLHQNAKKSLHVSYERLCEHPAAETHAITEFLGIDRNDAMIEYGRHSHHEGYGDENARQHHRPHTESISRWDCDGGLTLDQQRTLLDQCGENLLTKLGYESKFAMAGVNP